MLDVLTKFAVAVLCLKYLLLLPSMLLLLWLPLLIRLLLSDGFGFREAYRFSGVDSPALRQTVVVCAGSQKRPDGTDPTQYHRRRQEAIQRHSFQRAYLVGVAAEVEAYGQYDADCIAQA